MPSQLSSLLVRDGLTTPRRIERALMRQVVHGGALDTILLEMEAIPEDRLTQYLSLATGLPPASKTETDVFDAEAIRACPQELADTYQVAPLSLSDSVLRVLVCEPVNLGKLEELANQVGLGLQPMVVPEYRYQVILGRIYGNEIRDRFTALAEKQQGVTFAATGGVEPVILAADRVVVDTPLESETAPAPRPEPAPAAESEPSQPAEKAKATPEKEPAKTEPAEAAPTRHPARTRALSSPPDDGAVIECHGPAPLAPSDALEALAASQDRDEIFEIMLRGMRALTRFAALFTVQGDKAVGRSVLHDGRFGSVDARELVIPLSTASAFKNSVTSGSPFIGPLASGHADVDQAVAKLGDTLPPVGLILPIAVRGRVVAFAVAHSGSASKWIAKASKLFPLASETANAVERLLISKTKASPASAEPAKADAEPATKAEGKKGRGKRKRSKAKAKDAAR